MPEGAVAAGQVFEGLRSEPQLGRVAFLTNFIPPYRKPVLSAFAEHCQHLKVLVSTPMEANRAWRVDWDGLDVHVQKTLTIKQRWRHANVGSEAMYVHVPTDTFAVLSRFQPDVIISVEMGMRTASAALYRRFHRNSRLLVWADYAESTEHGRGLKRTILRHLLKGEADGFVVNGASGARYMRSLGVEEIRLYKIPYATDVALFGEAPVERPSDAAKRLLYVGQLIERKGIIPFLRVLTQWANAHTAENVEFTIAGEGPVRKEIESFPVPSNVRLQLLGNVPYDRLRTIYKESGVFVLPAFADTWAVVVNEAMAAALPVLGSICAQAVEEMVCDGKTGWLFNPAREATVYAAIDRCFGTSVKELSRMRKEARATSMSLHPNYTAELLVQAALSCRS